jgi:hypothetical protein
LAFLAVGEGLRKVPKGNLKAWVANNETILGFSYDKAWKMLKGYNRFGQYLRQRDSLTEEDALAISRFPRQHIRGMPGNWLPSQSTGKCWT